MHDTGYTGLLVYCAFSLISFIFILLIFSRFLIFFKRKLDEFSFTLPSWPFWTLDWMDNAARVPRHSVQAAGGCVVRGKSGSRSTRWWGFPFPCGRIRWKREEKWAHWLVLFIKSFDPMEISSATWKVSKNVLLKTIVKLNPIPCLCVRFLYIRERMYYNNNDPARPGTDHIQSKGSLAQNVTLSRWLIH